MVKAGLADRFEVQLAYVIGGARPISLNVETFGTGKVSTTRSEPDRENFDFSPGAIIDAFSCAVLSIADRGLRPLRRPGTGAPGERTDLAPSWPAARAQRRRSPSKPV